MDYYVIGRNHGKSYWWGPFTREEANKNFEKRVGMYHVLKIVFDITP
jgi:hypothetical protein